ncbi:hypothetical protein [Jongsikchunia kroppenstedtii]|jgi:hypothetical protein|uniref:hypothetical protein n=1 Tax=Jongsikchunia kroppenstedtii TaxID=1121721 RepID=UPI00036081D2|nr:hypothetical protein [Jongsikchunia kroppenstedtii]
MIRNIRFARAASAAALTAVAGAALLAVGTGPAAAVQGPCNAHQNLIAGVDTDNARAAICQWQGDGRLAYFGLNRNTGDTIVLEDAIDVSHGGTIEYAATADDGTIYQVYPDERLVIVSPAHRVIFDEWQVTH